jgi:hypothetical protein
VYDFNSVELMYDRLTGHLKDALPQGPWQVVELFQLPVASMKPKTGKNGRAAS